MPAAPHGRADAASRGRVRVVRRPRAAAPPRAGPRTRTGRDELQLEHATSDDLKNHKTLKCIPHTVR